MKNHLLATLLLIFTSACASVQSVSLTSIPADRKKPVQAQATKTIFLGFNFDNDFVDQLTPNLEKQCPEGKVAGLLTKDESINYFFYIVVSELFRDP